MRGKGLALTFGTGHEFCFRSCVSSVIGWGGCFVCGEDVLCVGGF